MIYFISYNMKTNIYLINFNLIITKNEYKFKNLFSSNKIILVWLIILISLPILGGFIKAWDTSNLYNTGGDTVRFLELSESLLKGGPIGGKQAFYIGYSLILSFFLKFKLSFNFLVLLQTLMTLISAICIKKFQKNLGINIQK